MRIEIAVPHNINSDSAEFARIKTEMRERGAPIIRVVHVEGTYYQALEGSSRLYAAYDLDCGVVLDVLDHTGTIEHDFEDVQDNRIESVLEYLYSDYVDTLDFDESKVKFVNDKVFSKIMLLGSADETYTS